MRARPTLLSRAARRGDAVMVGFLLANGALVDGPGPSAIGAAVDHWELPEWRGRDGTYKARDYPYWDVISLLVSAGADPPARLADFRDP